MNKERIEGNWEQFKGKVRERWGKISDDEIDVMRGKHEQLVGKIKEKYGESKEDVEKAMGDIERDL